MLACDVLPRQSSTHFVYKMAVCCSHLSAATAASSPVRLLAAAAKPGGGPAAAPAALPPAAAAAAPALPAAPPPALPAASRAACRDCTCVWRAATSCCTAHDNVGALHSPFFRCRLVGNLRKQHLKAAWCATVKLCVIPLPTTTTRPCVSLCQHAATRPPWAPEPHSVMLCRCLYRFNHADELSMF
jgi:hypothetical protein